MGFFKYGFLLMLHLVDALSASFTVIACALNIM